MQTVDASSKNAFAYDASASGPTYYNYFREYDPSTGRYVQSDPIGLAAGPNTFTYVGNNPLRYSDHRGLSADPPGTYISYEGSLVRPDGFPWGFGCGDSKTDDWVADLFNESCKRHDKCYADQCGKEKCDKDFYEDMKKERPDLPKILAWLYFQAVDKLGNDAYKNAGKR